MAYSSPYAPDHLPNDLILDTSRWHRRSLPWEVTWGHNRQPGLAGDSAQRLHTVDHEQRTQG